MFKMHHSNFAVVFCDTPTCVYFVLSINNSLFFFNFCRRCSFSQPWDLKNVWQPAAKEQTRQKKRTQTEQNIRINSLSAVALLPISWFIHLSLSLSVCLSVCLSLSLSLYIYAVSLAWRSFDGLLTVWMHVYWCMCSSHSSCHPTWNPKISKLILKNCRGVSAANNYPKGKEPNLPNIESLGPVSQPTKVQL